MRIKTAHPIPMRFIKRIFQTPCGPADDIIIRHISTDTRELEKGDLYFALKGEQFDGEDFIPLANSKGAYTVGKSSGAAIGVHDSSDALIDLAHAYKKLFFGIPTVAITGSVGKTTTKDLTASLLSAKYRIYATKGNLNNEIGLPLSLLSVNEDTEIGIFEMGMNHTGEIRKLSLCAEPTLSVITCIGTAHIGNLGSRKAIAAAKSEILDGMKMKSVLIPYGEPLLKNTEGGITVSSVYKDADHYLEIISENADILAFRYHSKNISTPPMCITSPGIHIAPCLAFALAVCEHMGFSEEDIVSAVNQSVFPAKKILHLGNISILNDCYNSSPESVYSSLATLSHYEKRSALLGDMLELGDHSIHMHVQIGRAAAEIGLSRLYLFGKMAKYIKRGAADAGMPEDRMLINEDISRPYISAEQILSLSDGETVLFKASRGMHLENIISIIKDYYRK